MKTNILAAAAFLLLLGTAGGIERESLPLLPGLCLMALALAVFGATIHHINRRKEVHTMHTPSAKLSITWQTSTRLLT